MDNYKCTHLHYTKHIDQLTFKPINLKLTEYHTTGKWSIRNTKHHKENQLLSLKHPYSNILIYDTHYFLFNPPVLVNYIQDYIHQVSILL